MLYFRVLILSRINRIPWIKALLRAEITSGYIKWIRKKSSDVQSIKRLTLSQFVQFVREINESHIQIGNLGHLTFGKYYNKSQGFMRLTYQI